jgi:hypothetical protein
MTARLSTLAAFFKSISLRSENALQDILRLLTLWFKYGAHDDVSNAMLEGAATVEVDTWLEVIPQVGRARSCRRTWCDTFALDYCPHSDTEHEHPTWHQQPPNRRRQSPSAGDGVSSYSSIEIVQRITEERGSRHHAAYEGA